MYNEVNRVVNEELIMKDFDKFIKDLGLLISKKSVHTEAEAGKPFGEEVDSALNTFINIAKNVHGHR
jgi:hypothetical protein